MARNTLHIDLLGRSVTISAEEDPDYLQAVLDYYRRALGSIGEKTGVKDPLLLAILTGFELSDEVKKLSRWRRAQSSDDAEAERIACDLISRIDAVVERG
ncbi:MAG: cell division protein ZapA [Treponema sp.]|jgi:cell division protein ZapA (FtsZ GTPase activity inhibitor)|nr:cell division protein ZapA [Treponema sp.]